MYFTPQTARNFRATSLQFRHGPVESTVTPEAVSSRPCSVFFGSYLVTNLDLGESRALRGSPNQGFSPWDDC